MTMTCVFFRLCIELGDTLPRICRKFPLRSRRGREFRWVQAMVSDAQIFRQPDFRFVVNFFQTAEAVKRKPVDGDCTDFTDERLIERGAAAFFVDEGEHAGASGLFDHELMKPFHVLRTAQAMVAWNQIEFDGK
jgi:hypothetical protein